LKLRRATVADAARLSLIGQATFLETFANDHDGDQVMAYLASEQTSAYYAEALRTPGVAAWLIEEAAGCPVGYAMGQPANLPFTDVATDYELKRFYILSKWHRGGWGAKLYDLVEAEARHHRARRLALSVYILNHAAQRYYKTRGFEEIGRWLFEGFDTSEDLIYAKTL
jgi:diamine N-acetyltransferase